jgi:uncharacterized protein YndB with AHSA1/START domain
MNPKPTGRLTLLGGRTDLELERHFKASIEDVWQSITDPDSMSRWIGTFSGETGPGKTVQFRMLFEQGDAVSNVLIEACEPPHRLVVSAKDDHGSWHLELRLKSAGNTTTLTFVQHLDDPKLAGDVGPGWEYYLDMLVAARTGAPRPSFDDYYPSQREYYLEQVK